MAEITEHKAGMFWWADVMTTDAAGGKAFYTALFGWNATDMPAGEGFVYTMFDKGGKSVCALAEMGPDMRQQVGRSFWQAYLTVEDVDAAAAKVEGLGGKVLMPPFDVMDAGRMAAIQDPTGAAVNLWQKRSHGGAEVFSEANTLTWCELYTSDRDAASRFYSELVGWRVQKEPMGDGSFYHVFMVGDEYAAGMPEIPSIWGEIPPNWSVYFAVDDCDAIVKEANRLGAKTVVPPTEVPVGTFAFLQDPQGAYFAVIQLLEVPA